MDNRLPRRCIFCLKTKTHDQFHPEHVYPEAVGGTLVIWSVCIPCNSTLGHAVDGRFVNLWHLQAQRALLGIGGKTGAIPNPFAEGTIAGDPRQKIRTTINADGVVQPHIVRSVERSGIRPDGSEHIRMAFDASERDEIPDVVNTILRRRQRPELAREEILAHARVQSATPEIQVSISIDADVQARGLLKIAYELATEWLGPEYLDDPTARTIRACLKRTEEPVSAFRLNGSAEMGTSSWGSDTTSHIAILFGIADAIAVHVRVLGVCDGTFVMSHDPRRYPLIEPQFLAIDPQSGEIRMSSLAREMARMGLKQ